MNINTTKYIREPKASDGAAIYGLVKRTPSLDLNSPYSYLLLCEHFYRTCLVTEVNHEIVGFVSGYIPPVTPNVLFVWQVAVDSSMRRQGLARKMIETLLARSVCSQIKYLECTVTPDNKASRKLFGSIARDHQTELRESVLFNKKHFGNEGHEEECLLRIGPLSLTPKEANETLETA